ncbi:MAG TPA: hypothetical protein PLM79_17380 [Syntrophobacteraceae bacterium]|nr:hypothetical protein [Syntrophobacteraceae bacterium]
MAPYPGTGTGQGDPRKCNQQAKTSAPVQEWKEIALGLVILRMFWDLAGFGVNSWDWEILGVSKTQFVGGLGVRILRLKLRFGDQKWGGVFGVRIVYKLFAN